MEIYLLNAGCFIRKRLLMIIMKTFIFLFCTTVFSFTTTTSFSQEKVSIDKDKEVSITQVFEIIKQQTNYRFIYPKKAFKNLPSVKLEKGEINLSELLIKSLSNTNLSYVLTENNNILVKKNDTPADAINVQQIMVKGTVKDGNGQALPGANIVEKGTTNGTQSDFDGNFTLAVSNNKAIIVVSYIGFTSKEVLVGDQSNIVVELKEDAESLEGVVLVGYGTVAKKDATGAISTVSADSYENQPVSRIGEALQGRAPGVQATQTSGAPDAGLKIRIRGANSISSNNEPLYIIDGLAVGSINDINVNDIKSLSILKDASATAIYGSRGANGVVLITTKDGRKDDLRVTYNSFAGTSQTPKRLSLMNGADFAEAVNEVEAPTVFYTADEIAALRVSGGEDWQERVFKTGFFTNQDLSVSGGNEKTDFYVSGNYYSNDGIVVGKDYKRFSGRTKINTQLSDHLKGGINIYATHTKTDGLSANLSDALVFDPTTFAYNENGDYNFNSLKGAATSATNPLIAAENTIHEILSNKFIVNSYLNYQISDNLELNISGGIDQSQNITNHYEPILINGVGKASVLNSSSSRFQNTNRLTYSKEFNENHKLKVDAIFEQQKSSTNWVLASGEGFFSDNNTYKQLLLANIKNNEYDSYSESLLSYASRVNYTLFDKLSVTATLRADGSSKFRDGNRWGYFPSGAISYNMSNEDFIRNSHVFDNLKIRAGYGITGNQGIDPRSTYSRARLGLEFNYPWEGAAAAVGFAPSLRIDNKDLTWETTAQFNSGIDMSLFESKIRFSFDYYKKNTTDLLLDVVLPQFIGANLMTINVGEIENKGFDLSLGATLAETDDFSINSTFTLSSNRNKVLSLVDGSPIEKGSQYFGSTFPVKPTRVEVGQPISSFRGYVFEGVYQLGEEAEAAKFGRKAGDAKYKDVNGDGIISTDDITVIGNGNPDFTWGLNTDIDYKKFSLNIFVLGAQGNDVYNFTRGRQMSLGAQTFHAVHQDWNDRWSTTNASDIPSGRDGTQLLSSQFLEDGSFIRMKNIGLSYTFDNVKYVKSLKLKLNADNLFIITKYKGFDPEATVTGGSDVDLGIDFNAYPIPRNFTLGLTATF